MRLDLAGDLGGWQGLALAALGGFLAWRLYRRDVRSAAKPWARTILPALRTGAIAAVILCLVGPVLTHRKTEGEVGRVLVFVDGSRSMGLTDEHLDPGRKLLIVAAGTSPPDAGLSFPGPGMLPPDEARLAEILDLLREARRLIADADVADDGSGIGLEERLGKARSAIDRVGKLLPRLDPADLPRSPGSILVEYFDGIPGNKLRDLEASGRLGGSPVARVVQAGGAAQPPPDAAARQGSAPSPQGSDPSRSESRSSFASERNRGDAYGTRIRGILVPPLTGKYVFRITGDDEAVLLLSTSADPAAKRAVARVSEWAGHDEWEKSPEQRSEPIELRAGGEYHVEVLHKEGSGEDHVAVGWLRPDGKEERPIPGIYLSPPESGGAGALARLVAAHDREVAAAARRIDASPEALAKPGGRSRIAALAERLGAWEERLAEMFAKRARAVLEGGPPDLRSAVAALDATSRWRRAEALLLDGDSGLVPAMADTHEIELFALSGSEARRLWHTASAVSAPVELGADPTGEATDLSSGIAASVGEEGDRTAVVLLSDGRHNDGGPPAALAKVLGQRGVPIFAVGLGAHRDPPDLSVAGVDGPASVFAEDRFHGQVTVGDFMPPGIPFVVTISHGEKELWRKDLETTGGGERRLEVDFPVKEIVPRPGGSGDVEVLSLPASLRVAIEPVGGETRRDNNEAPFWFRVVTQGRKILLVDGRPRWETRFVRNLFERDSQWRIDPLIAEVGGGAGEWTHGDGAAGFPRDRESLFAYGFIVFGEVPAGKLRDEELLWIREFVERRGGGILFVDGRRGHLRHYEKTPIGPLLPVELPEDAGDFVPERLELTAAGRESSAFRLEKDSGANAALWRKLPAPHWAAPCRALEGTETFAEAVGRDGRKVPALVARRFGAGRALYASFDATWRWRYEVADRYHVKYWNQVAGWLMEEPFAVRDDLVALDVGEPVYHAGDSARVRVRLAGRDGKPLLDAKAEAFLFRDGRKVATFALEPDPNLGGLYRGATAELEPGEYEVGLLVEGFSELETRARTSFGVRPRQARELAVLTADESLLRGVAAASGGEYLREEEAGRLPSLLRPLSEGRIVLSETRLAQSYWWFVPIVGLLALEWFLRKRAGMI